MNKTRAGTSHEDSLVWRARAALANSSLFRNSLMLVSGTVASQAILFVLSPLLSRVFAVADFGNLANYNAWVAALALVSCLRYEHAIIIARDRETTNQVLVLTGVLCLLSVAVYTIAAILIHSFYTGTAYLSTFHDYILFMPPGVLAICVASPLSQLNIKLGRFRTLALVATWQVACTILPQIVLGLLRVPNGLILGSITGSTAAAIVLSITSLDRQRLKELRSELDVRKLRATAMMHVKFPRYTFVADLIALGAQQFVPVFILALFSPAVAGLYAFSLRIVRVPLLVVATAAAGALRKEAADHLHSGSDLRRVFSATVRSLLAIGIVPFLLMLIGAKPLFGIVFGHQWVEAGRLVQIMSPGVLLEFVALPMSVFFLVTNSQQYTLVIQVVGLVLLVSAFVFGRYVLHDFLQTCAIISGVSGAGQLGGDRFCVEGGPRDSRAWR